MDAVELTAILGNIGEFVGALAVVGTLLYLAIQVRDGRRSLDANTRSIQAQALSNWMPIDVMLMDPMVRDGDFSTVMLEVLANDRLDFTDAEVMRVAAYLHAAMSCGEMIYFQVKLGSVEHSLIERRVKFAGHWLNTPGGKFWWKEMGSVAYSDEYIEWVDAMLAEAPEGFA